MATSACTGSTVNLGGNTVNVEEGNSWNGRRLQGTAPPVSGTFSLGDIVWNSATSYNSPLGWICTTAGSPGTWQVFARNGLPITQASASSPVLFKVNGGPSFEVLEAAGGGASATDYAFCQGSGTASSLARCGAAGTDANIGFAVDSKGTSPVYLRPGSSAAFTCQSSLSCSVSGALRVGNNVAPSNTASGAITTTSCAPVSQAFGDITCNGAVNFLTFTSTLAANSSATAVVSNTNVNGGHAFGANSAVFCGVDSQGGSPFTNGFPIVSCQVTALNEYTITLANIGANALTGTLTMKAWVIN